MKVLIIDTIAPEGIAYLTERGFEVDQVSSKLPKDELHARLGEYEAIVTRSSTTVTAEFLGRARRLRILGRAGVGVDNIDVDACSRQGCPRIGGVRGPFWAPPLDREASRG